MKKILMSFLMMAMRAGCVQQVPMEAEKPEDVPVVEQPEKPVVLILLMLIYLMN